MAWYGYVDVPHSTYTEWKNNTVGNGYNLDNSYGCQCWDFASLFWRNIGFPSGYPQTGPNLAAYECWTVSRSANQGDKFDLIYDKTQIKTGDVIVMGPVSFNPYGHITFADEGYNGTDSLRCFGQNQGGGTPDPAGGTTASVNVLGLDQFLGAFRYKGWESSPPPSSKSRGHFPWVLYQRRLNQRRNNML